MAPSNHILVIGAGELGLQVIKSLAKHPRRDGKLAVLLRPGTIASTNPSKQAEVNALREMDVELVPGDIAHDSEQQLASLFAKYNTVVGCAGFVSGAGGVQLKLTRAALRAGVPKFIPWQFGVDYDVIGRGSTQDLFDEQLDVRDALRAQDRTRWAIISTGMFTSFLFEAFFGVVDLQTDTVRALGSPENRVTLTTPEDIGRITAEIVLDDDSFANKPIFIGGDTISYGELANLVEKVVQRPIKRTVLSFPEVKAALAKDPDNNVLKYQGIFSAGRGVAWDLAETWNQKRGIRGRTVEEWAREHLLEQREEKDSAIQPA
ncbi:hypothetical protein N7468_006180 [Penicillium chermesinum]|uniref:NmrA-like domain-containing protein n=1 Tax=Penicillium chermesinum TaxID=63820 RepID=A0A9W9NRS4_9EURO|nr:uncharacterized protein N7468_006180 [Penicillium chermesinum]KAJ5224955.1 hypothetical protein N7468_006180 [Penicillium chermesinum]KAJ6151687.1 hypothetical protein N7470_006815 [Penicillium chermesinum]